MNGNQFAGLEREMSNLAQMYMQTQQYKQRYKQQQAQLQFQQKQTLFSNLVNSINMLLRSGAEPTSIKPLLKRLDAATDNKFNFSNIEFEDPKSVFKFLQKSNKLFQKSEFGDPRSPQAIHAYLQHLQSGMYKFPGAKSQALLQRQYARTEKGLERATKREKGIEGIFHDYMQKRWTVARPGIAPDIQIERPGGRGLAGLVAPPRKYQPTTQREAIELKKAGAPSMTQIIGAEKFGLQKRLSASEQRQELLRNAMKKEFFDTHADDFNVMSANEVAYWDTADVGLLHREGRGKFVKLTRKNIKDGWTPAVVQKFAEDNAMTVYEVLQEIRAVK